MANNLAAFNAQVWSKRLVQNINQINVMLPLVNKDYEGELQGVGDTVKVRTLGSITFGAYTKNSTTISYQDLSPVVESFTIADAEYFAFKVDDVDKAQNDMNVLDLYVGRAAVALSNLIEAKLLSKYASAASANKITGASSAAITLTSNATDGTSVYDNFVAARTALRIQEVPMTGLWAVIDPATTALLLKDTTHFIRATELGDAVVTNGVLGIKMADGTIRPGYVGRCANFDVFESTQVPVASGAKYLQFGNSRAISYAAQLVEMEMRRIDASFANTVRGLIVHDATVFAETSKCLATVKATP
jgi:P22 coat protein - gene protein 5